MIHVVSMGNSKAEVILQEPNGRSTTVHLLYDPGARVWRDKWSTRYNLEVGEVDWLLYYRNKVEVARFEGVLREGEGKKFEEFITNVQNLAHEANRVLGPEAA